MEKTQIKLLIDIGHPAHIHYFKNCVKAIQKNGGDALFIIRDKDVIIDLVESYGFHYVNLGKPYKSIAGKLFGMLVFTLRIIIIAWKFKPDFFLNATIYAAVAAWIMRKPHISLEDTYNNEQVKLYLPFTTLVVTGDFPHPSLGRKEIRCPCYHELLYLHTNYFKPDYNILKELGISAGEKYFILRFVSWNASHDVGHMGINNELKRDMIKLLSKYGKVFISSESQLDEDMRHLLFPLHPSKMHHALAFASMFVGEGATMASECAMLGTPAVYINSQEAYTIDHQEKECMMYHFRTPEGVLGKVQELLEDSELKSKSLMASKAMIAEKIDYTAFLIWLIEKWPESCVKLKECPEYLQHFKSFKT